MDLLLVKVAAPWCRALCDSVRLPLALATPHNTFITCTSMVRSISTTKQEDTHESPNVLENWTCLSIHTYFIFIVFVVFCSKTSFRTFYSNLHLKNKELNVYFCKWDPSIKQITQPGNKNDRPKTIKCAQPQTECPSARWLCKRCDNLTLRLCHCAEAKLCFLTCVCIWRPNVISAYQILVLLKVWAHKGSFLLSVDTGPSSRVYMQAKVKPRRQQGPRIKRPLSRISFISSIMFGLSDTLFPLKTHFWQSCHKLALETSRRVN